MTAPSKQQTRCRNEYTALQACLQGVYDAIDELEDAAHDYSTDSLEYAMSTVDSCLEELEDQVSAYLRVAEHCEGCLDCLKKVLIKNFNVQGVRNTSMEALQMIDKILDEMPSDGEDEEDYLEELRLVAEDFLETARNYFNDAFAPQTSE